MKGRGGRILCYLALCLLTANTAASDSSCEQATVVFPNWNIRLDVNSTPTTVHFNISSDCFDRIAIRNDQGQQCNIRNPAPTDGDCPCDRTGAGFRCSTSGNIPRRSPQTWTIGVTKVTKRWQKTTETAVSFNVTYPTILEYFNVNNHGNKSLITVPEGTVQFRCHWKDGNLKQSIELRGPRNNTLTTWTKRDYDQTSFPLSCADSGEYRCQVEGTDEFKSLTVLVKCPLVFKPQSPSIPEQAVEAGSDASFSFQVTSYSATLQTCQLTKPDGTSVDCNSCTSVVYVLGLPPHLDVTVTLKRVTEKDGGNWKLAASNPYVPKRTAEKRFRLVVTQLLEPTAEKRSTEEPTAEKRSTEEPTAEDCSCSPVYRDLAVGLATALALVLALAGAVVCWLWRRGWSLPCSDRPREDGNDGHSPQPALDDDYLEPMARAPLPPEPSENRHLAIRDARPSSSVYSEPVFPPGDLAQVSEPYENLRMADVGVPSVYSGIRHHGNPTPQRP